MEKAEDKEARQWRNQANKRSLKRAKANEEAKMAQKGAATNAAETISFVTVPLGIRGKGEKAKVNPGILYSRGIGIHGTQGS